MILTKISASCLAHTDLIKYVIFRIRVAVGVNATLILRNWSIGSRIWEDILGKERAPYEKKIVATLSQQLSREYGRGIGIVACERGKGSMTGSRGVDSSHKLWDNWITLCVASFPRIQSAYLDQTKSRPCLENNLLGVWTIRY